MQDEDWSDYQAFLALARSGRLNRAAKTAGVDATTLGRRIRRLEARLGRTLFEQTRNGQILTETGETMLAEVESMEAAALRISDSTPSGSQVSGLLRISVSEGFGTALVAQRLPTLLERYPRLEIDLVASSGFLSPSKREADLAIVLSRPVAGPLIAGKLTNYALRLYANASYLAGQPPITERAQLAEHRRLIGYVPDLLYAPELGYLSEIDPRLTANLRSPSINAQHALIRAGAGIGVLPCFMGEADPNLVAVLPDISILRSFWIVTHKDTHKVARIQAFRDWIFNLVQTEQRLLLPEAR